MKSVDEHVEATTRLYILSERQSTTN